MIKPKRIAEIPVTWTVKRSEEHENLVLKINEIIRIVNAHNECGCICVMEDVEYDRHDIEGSG